MPVPVTTLQQDRATAIAVEDYMQAQAPPKTFVNKYFGVATSSTKRAQEELLRRSGAVHARSEHPFQRISNHRVTGQPLPENIQSSSHRIPQGPVDIAQGSWELRPSENHNGCLFSSGCVTTLSSDETGWEHDVTTTGGNHDEALGNEYADNLGVTTGHRAQNFSTTEVGTGSSFQQGASGSSALVGPRGLPHARIKELLVLAVTWVQLTPAVMVATTTATVMTTPPPSPTIPTPQRIGITGNVWDDVHPSPTPSPTPTTADSTHDQPSHTNGATTIGQDRVVKSSDPGGTVQPCASTDESNNNNYSGGVYNGHNNSDYYDSNSVSYSPTPTPLPSPFPSPTRCRAQPTST